MEIELTLYDDDCEVVMNCKKVCVFLPQQVALVKRLLKEAKNQQHDYPSQIFTLEEEKKLTFAQANDHFATLCFLKDSLQKAQATLTYFFKKIDLGQIKVKNY